MNKVVLGSIALLLVSAGVLTIVVAARSAGKKNSQADQSTAYDHGDWQGQSIIGDFILTERSGKKFNSADMSGRVWVATFFFASCPGECTRQNEQVAALAREFADKDVTFVSITVDPETDTPARLRQYADGFKADADKWLFLTGEKLHIHRIGTERFKLNVDKETHSSRLALVDRHGKMIGAFSWKDPESISKLKIAIRKALAESV